MVLESLMTDTEGYVREHGPVTVGVVIFLESFGAPLPGESLLILSGALAARGELSLIGLLVWAWIGAVAGDSVGYWIGRKFGRTLIVRYGTRVGLTHERFAKVESVFARFGPVAVAFARFFDILRQLNGLVAGTAGMSWPRFLAFNMLGGLLWVSVWGLGAWYFADHVADVKGLMRHLGVWGVAAGAVAVLAVVGLVIVLARKTSPAGGNTAV